jgi:hypothetical protein
MTVRHKLALALLSAMAALIAQSAQAKTPEERCDELYNIYFRYAADRTHHHDGEVAGSALAKYQCESGRTAEGLRSLEAILTRNLLPYPKE